jgi:glycosyltransferase involved in cell wall biosynthesis
LASFIDSNEQDEKERLEQKGIRVHTISYPRNQLSVKGKVSSGFRSVGPFIDYMLGNEPFFFAKYNKKKMADLISKLIHKNTFDIAQVEYNIMYHYLDQIENIPKVINFHDISTKVYERGMNQSDTANRRSFEMAKKLEPIIANQFQAVVTLSKEDRSYLLGLGCKTKIHVIPPQIKIPQLIDIIKKSNEVCFIGSYNREPNIQAVKILVDEIFPKLNNEIKLNIIGKGLSKDIVTKIKGNNRINYLGFIDDIDSFLSTQMLMIAPIRIGAGLKMKIPHALVCSTPVITTDVGAEGIDINENNGMWVTTDTIDMIKLINKLLSQNDLLIEKGQLGRDAVIELFSEEKIISQFESLYSDLLNK